MRHKINLSQQKLQKDTLAHFLKVAQEASELEKIENDIKNFASLLNNSLEIKNFLHNPTQSKENQNNVLKLLADKLNFSKNLKNFILSTFILLISTSL